MKIAFVLDDSLDRTDGVQQYVTTLGQWLSSQGHEVHYLVGHTTRTDIPHIHSLSKTLKVRANQNRLSTPLPAGKRKIRKLLKHEQFDILHIQMPYSPFLAAKVIKEASPKTAIIGTFHILPFSRLEATGTSLLGRVLRPTLKRFDRIVSVSEPAAAFARKSFHIQTEVLPNAVELGKFQTGKKLKQYDDGKLNIIYLGRLVERKGCMHLLTALVGLQHAYDLEKVRLIIAGTGPLEKKLKYYAKKYNLQDIVEFVGYVPEKEKPDYLATADIAVIPSTGGESFGIVLVEAMAAGADVVVAGDNPGYRFVLNGSEEQLVDPQDTEAFVKVLRYFIQDNQARKQAKLRQITLMAAYDVREVGRKLLKIYDQTLRSKRTMR
jgi:phosphatidyl-myo-inositol alpha-mannosyltransferase